MTFASISIEAIRKTEHDVEFARDNYYPQSHLRPGTSRAMTAIGLRRSPRLPISTDAAGLFAPLRLSADGALPGR